MRDRSARQQAAAIRRQTVYGLVLGWVLALVGGFVFFCVPSRVDWLWAALLAAGIAHLTAAVLLPQLLAWPERAWIGLARWQGSLVMNVLLAIIYFTLIWPAGRFSRRRTSDFVSWDDQPPPGDTAWQPTGAAESAEHEEYASARRRSLPLLLAGVIAFFIRRGNYLVVPIIVLLLVLGLVLYFVQSSALAPFIYTFF